MFMWLKNLSRLVFENSAHKQISTIKDIPFQFGLFLPRIKIFPHKSIGLAKKNTDSHNGQYPQNHSKQIPTIFH